MEHDKRISASNGKRFRKDAIDKEMANAAVAFEMLDEGKPASVGWTQANGNIVFDVKMGFTRKSIWVKDGHMTVHPEHSTFSGVVSRESVRIALTYAKLNGLDVTESDINNYYLQASSSETHYVICGSTFGRDNIGKVTLICCAMYVGKSSGADFWKHLRSCMTHLGFTSFKADPDIWMS